GEEEQHEQDHGANDSTGSAAASLLVAHSRPSRSKAERGSSARRSHTPTNARPGRKRDWRKLVHRHSPSRATVRIRTTCVPTTTGRARPSRSARHSPRKRNAKSPGFINRPPPGTSFANRLPNTGGQSSFRRADERR